MAALTAATVAASTAAVRLAVMLEEMAPGGTMAATRKLSPKQTARPAFSLTSESAECRRHSVARGLASTLQG